MHMHMNVYLTYLFYTKNGKITESVGLLIAHYIVDKDDRDDF